MKKVFAIFTIVFAFTILSAAQAGGASGSAQSGAGDQSMDKKASPKKGAAGSATITGCLSGPNDEGVYELKSGKRTVAVGGLDDLSKHVGHEVRLHGSWAKSGSEIGEKEEKGGSEAAEKKEAMKKKASGTSKSPLSTTSRIAAPLVLPAGITKKKAALRLSSKYVFKSAVFGLRSASWWMQLQQRSRIKVFTAPAHGKVQVGSSGTASSATEGDQLPRRHFIAFFHLEFGEMHVNRHQSLAMVQHHAISFKIERPRQDHCSCVRGMDRRAGTRAEIQAQVLAFFHAIVDARTAKNSGGFGLRRRQKMS